jgi:predicted dehydrogenase
MVSLPSRCRADLLLAKKAVEDGVLGEVHFGRGRVAHGAALEGWFKGSSLWFADAKRAGGGALYDLGCHQMDIIPWLMGIPKKVTAIINDFSGAYGIDDNSVTLIEFENRAIGVVDVSWVHRKGPNPLELLGTAGSLVIGSHGVELESTKLDDAGIERYLAERPQELTRPLDQWVAAILRDTPMTITAQDGRLLTELMQAAYRSAETGAAVSLPL